MIRYVAHAPLTARWPVGTVFLVLALLVALGVARVVTRPAPRILLGLVSTVALVASAGVGVNAYFGYYRNLGEALGGSPSAATSLARVRARAGHGTVVALPVPGTASGFVARPAQVYLPPAWSRPGQPPLPVVLLLHGTPGDPVDRVEGGQARKTADTWAPTTTGSRPCSSCPTSTGRRPVTPSASTARSAASRPA